MGLNDLIRAAIPNATEQDGFTEGARSFLERKKIGLERQDLNRRENFRQLNRQTPIPQYDIAALQREVNNANAAGLRNVPVQDEFTFEPIPGAGDMVPREGPPPGVQAAPPVPDALTNENPFPGQITFPEYEQPDLTGLFPEGTTQKVDAQAEEKEALHVQGMPWKVVPKGNGQILVHNGVEYDIKDVFGDGSSLQIVDRYGRPNSPLTDAFTKGRAQGIVNTEINVGDVDTNVATPQAPTQNKFIDSAVASVKNDRFRNIQTQLTIEQARLLGIPEGEALALLAIESNFANIPFTGRKAKGALQIEAPAYKDVKQFYAGKTPAGADPAEWAKLKNIAANLPQSFTGLSDNRDQITASLLYLKLIKYKGVDPKFQGAAYNDGYGKFIGINSLRDVKKFAKNHDYNSVNTYNRAFVSLQPYLTQVGNYFYPVSGNQPPVPTVGPTQQVAASGASTTTTGNTAGAANAPPSTVVPPQTPIDSTGRTATVNQSKTNVTDAGLSKSASETIIKNPKKGFDVVSKLADDPGRLGFEFSKALENRNIIAQRIENMRIAGLTGIDNKEYAKSITDLMVLDSTLYVMQAMDGLNQFKNTGNPGRLNSILDAFTGGTALIQARTDGKFDFIRPDGSLIDPELEGLDMAGVTRNFRTIVDATFRKTIEANEAKSAALKVEAQLEMLKKANEIKLSTLADIMKENALVKTEMTADGENMIVTYGGVPKFALQKEDITVDVDGKTEDRTVFRPVELQNFSFGTSVDSATDNYTRALQNVGIM